MKTNEERKNPAPGIQITGKEEKTIANQKEMAAPNTPANSTSTADFNFVQVKQASVNPVKEKIAGSDSFTLINPVNQPVLTLSPEPAAVKKKLRIVYNIELAVTDPEEAVAADLDVPQTAG